MLSTDSDVYAAEAEKEGLGAPFRRPSSLSGSEATALDTIAHALDATEQATGRSFDVVVILEPTSPNRLPEDVERSVRMLIERSELDSVVTVSEIDAKCHPWKVFRVHDQDMLEYAAPEGAAITSRHQLSQRYYTRNGACYALRRRCITERLGIVTSNSAALVIDRPLANIDSPFDLEVARLLWSMGGERR